MNEETVTYSDQAALFAALSKAQGAFLPIEKNREVMIQTRQGVEISAPEEVAYINGWISREKLLESAERYGKSPYGGYLKNVAEGKIRY